MRRLFISALMPFVLAIPASAQNAAPTQNAKTGAAPAQNQASSQNPTTPSIVQTIRSDLEQAGFTDIEVIPRSFLVRAKDQYGNPAVLVVGPDSISAITEGLSGQGDGQSSTNGTGAGGTPSAPSAPQ
jgi:hypothetical protein